MALRFAEQLLVLIADSGHGNRPPVRTLHYGLSGAALLELTMANRVDSDPSSLSLVDATPVGDKLLDHVLGEIAREPERQSCEFWIRHLARNGEELQELALDRLAAEGIMDIDDGGVFALACPATRPGRHSMAPPPVPPAPGGDTYPRLLALLFSDDIPSPEEAALAGLMHACNLFRRLLTETEYKEVEKRIELFARLDLVGRALVEAVRNLTIAESVAARRRQLEPGGRRWPVAGGRLPVIGHGHRLVRNPDAYLMAQYREHGPVFEVNILRTRFLVMAGREANQFVGREGKDYLRVKEGWASLAWALGSENFVVALDGAGHQLLRRTMRRSYSGRFFLDRLEEATAVTRRWLDALPADRPVVVVDAMRRIVTEQITVLTAGTSSLDHIEDLITYARAALMVTSRRHPRLALRLPRVRRARRRLEQLVEQVIEGHELERRGGEHDDLVNDFLELHRSSPGQLSNMDLFANVLSPFIAGLDTAAPTLSFALYALLKHPDAMTRARAEADEMFAAGGPTEETLRAMSVCRSVLQETLRLYSIAPALTPRMVINTFDFAGYRIPHGTNLLIALSMTHHLPEHFPDPERFDIDRYSAERREHAQPGAYVPFGVGHHTCLGNGFAQLQMLLTLATLLHGVDVTLDPPGYRLDVVRTPGKRPSDKFRVRLSARSRQGGVRT